MHDGGSWVGRVKGKVWLFRLVSMAWVFSLVGCETPYVPQPVHHPRPLAADAFDRVRGLLLDRYGRLTVSDRPAFRLQTDWLPFQRGDLPGHRRATVFCDDGGQLQVVVEVQFVQVGWSGPYRTGTIGDSAAEQELAGALERMLGRSRSAFADR